MSKTKRESLSIQLRGAANSPTWLRKVGKMERATVDQLLAISERNNMADCLDIVWKKGIMIAWQDAAMLGPKATVWLATTFGLTLTSSDDYNYMVFTPRKGTWKGSEY